MNISEIATYVWNNSQLIDFGQQEDWDLNLFTKPWVRYLDFHQKWKDSGAGWYWFGVNMTGEDMHRLVRPAVLPLKGCDIGLLSHENYDLLTETLRCTPSEGRVVVYNGHQADVTGRIRQHFALTNEKTGALGLRHYKLSQKSWFVRYFSEPYFQNIEGCDKEVILRLMNSTRGRGIVESAWRVNYGWPVLCKE